MVQAVGLGISAFSVISQRNSAKKASKSADAQAQLSYELGMENLNFQKDQYKDWKAVYGSVQENLGRYYKSLTPERLTTLGLQNQQKEYQAAVADINKLTAQRGLEGSGLETATLAQARIGNAEARANIRTQAVDQVNQQKASFLSIGMGTGNAMLNNIAQTGATNSTNASNRASSYLNSYTDLQKQASDTMSTLGGGLTRWGMSQ